MNAKKNAPTTKTYAVSGKTLDEINKDMLKKGPADPNESRRYSGSCLGKFVLGITDKDWDFVTTPDSSPVEVTVTVKGGTITSSPAITMPKLASEKDLSPNALKEWKRFVGAVDTHENGHATSLYNQAVKISDEFNKLSGTGTGKDEKTAKAAAHKDLVSQIQKEYGGTGLDDRVKDDIKAYDAKTQHGASQGAVLDTSIK
jgi:predicted secreted Zn-dependent protease